MGYTVYWTRNDDQELTREQLVCIAYEAQKVANKYRAKVVVSPDETSLTVSGGCESLVIGLRANMLCYTSVFLTVHQFCKTNGYEYDTLVKTILMYLLSIGVISQFTHDGDKDELAGDVDAGLYKGLSGYDYTEAMGKQLLADDPDSDDEWGGDVGWDKMLSVAEPASDSDEHKNINVV